MALGGVLSILLCFVAPFTVLAVPCSYDVAYEVVVACNWTAVTHPIDYPSTAHFSQLCGTVHNANYTMWAVNGTATPGVQDIAEFGACSTFRSEATACEEAGNCDPGSYFAWPCVTENDRDAVCSFRGTVTLKQQYPAMSGLSMLAPSPDWNIGIPSLDLCQSDGSGQEAWLEEYPVNGTLPLYPIDAGTDGGTTFRASNVPLSPFEPIRYFEIDDPESIFFNAAENTTLPICQAKITRIE